MPFDCGFAIRGTQQEICARAAMEGAKARFRPILMTSLYCRFTPLVLQGGKGGNKLLEQPQQGMLIGTIAVYLWWDCITSLVE
jgi:multidrug efflux pump subunit AcrB